MSPLLEVERVSVDFGGVQALQDVSFTVQESDFMCLIGPNGAGKTTLLKAITGVVTPRAARIRISGQDITRMPTHRRARMGLALTHQIVRPFRSMDLLDNVALAAGHRRIHRVLRAMTSVDRSRQRRRGMELLELVGIGDHARQPVAGQPLGVLKRLEVARALALDPRILLLDEPLAGLNHVEAGLLADILKQINAGGLTVVMIEHNLHEVLRVGRRLVVLDNGRKIADGAPQAVMQMPDVRAAYVGTEKSDAAA